MRTLKITIIGAGSTYTPELIQGIISRKTSLNVGVLYLMDIDPVKLRIVGEFTKRMLLANNINTKVVFTDILDEAIEDADYILGQIRVGKLEARILDEKIPLKYDLIGQETTGAGGFMKAMRTIPVMMNIASKIESLAPKAWFINFTNPSGLIAETLLNYTHIKTIGLCNGPIKMIRNAKKLIPNETQSFDYDFVGLNHLCWITGVYADNKNILQDLLKKGIQPDVLKNIPQANYEPALLNAIKGLPIAYLNYYYFRDEQLQLCKDAKKTRGEVCVEIEKELLELYQDPQLKEKPSILDQRGGALYSEAAISLLDAIENDKNEIHVVDVLNCGAYPFMDNNDAVEVKCLVNRKGATPIKYENFNDIYIIGLMKAVKAYEKLAAKAGISGDYSSALAALMVHPLIGDYYKAKNVLDDMLEANKRFLPQFFK